MATVEERVSRLEGGYDHLATKADIHKVAVQLGIFMTGVIAAGVAFLRVSGT